MYYIWDWFIDRALLGILFLSDTMSIIAEEDGVAGKEGSIKFS